MKKAVKAERFGWRACTDVVALRLQRSFSWDEEKSRQIAEVAVDAIRVAFGGDRYYLPQRNGEWKDRIREEFNGRNIVELSKKYGVCASTVRNYLKD